MEGKLCIYAIIPARNEEDRIERALLALKGQTLSV